jgi:hypothetical protein
MLAEVPVTHFYALAVIVSVGARLALLCVACASLNLDPVITPQALPDPR